MFDLRGKVALVTGGGRGIGKAIAWALAEAGADVAVNYVSEPEKAEAVVMMIRKLGQRSIAVRGDVSKKDEVDAMVARVERELGQGDRCQPERSVPRRASGGSRDGPPWNGREDRQPCVNRLRPSRNLIPEHRALLRLEKRRHRDDGSHGPGTRAPRN